VQTALVIAFMKLLAAVGIALLSLSHASTPLPTSDVGRLVRVEEPPTEDSDGLWNCLTAGNRRCYAGAQVRPLP